MITLKLSYNTNEDNMSVINEYRRQYSLCFRFLYNRIYDNNGKISENELRQYYNKINGISDIKTALFGSCVKEALQIYKSRDDDHKKIIFGTRKTFNKICNHKITKEEWKDARLRSIYSIGEATKYSNRLFRIEQTLDTIIFQPNRNTKIEVKLNYINPKLTKLYQIQQSKSAPLTYTLNDRHVCISYDETLIENYIHQQKKNRVIGLDMNPNYIGLSIVDWYSSSDYKIIYTKTVDLCKFKSNPKLGNKKKHELVEISKWIIDLAIHYSCSLLSIEDLKIQSSDKKKGKRFNRECNNTWYRSIIIEQLIKRSNIHHIRMVKVKPEYSSFIGNFLYRDGHMPDMVLASIEIGRRGYEFVGQYITKILEQRKNIVFPDKKEFEAEYIKSLEEFNIGAKSDLSWIELYSYMKEMKIMYRFPLKKKKVFKFKSKKLWSKLI